MTYTYGDSPLGENDLKHYQSLTAGFADLLININGQWHHLYQFHHGEIIPPMSNIGKRLLLKLSFKAILIQIDKQQALAKPKELKPFLTRLSINISTLKDDTEFSQNFKQFTDLQTNRINEKQIKHNHKLVQDPLIDDYQQIQTQRYIEQSTQSLRDMESGTRGRVDPGSLAL
ncbi:MAG: hypothetical protein ACO2ZM_05465 [Francisellaceae bacterium]